MADRKEELVGKITHYFGKINVGVIEVTSGQVKVGDKIKIDRGENSFDQIISSMQVEHKEVEEAKKGDQAGLKVDQPVKGGDQVYKVIES